LTPFLPIFLPDSSDSGINVYKTAFSARCRQPGDDPCATRSLARSGSGICRDMVVMPDFSAAHPGEKLFRADPREVKPEIRQRLDN
jgi:hypothetical protein